MRMNTIKNREHWLITAADIMIDEIISPAITDIPPPQIRYSLTAPTTKQKKSVVLGSCWNRAASADGTNEIFITSNLDDSLRILDVLLHEQIHAFDDNQSGHGPRFQKLCRKVGLKGGGNGKVKESFTATVATPELKTLLEDIIADIGPIPHAKMDIDLNGTTKQKNRQKLMYCTNTGCEFKFRASQKMLDAMQYNKCLVCGDASLVQEQVI